MVVSVNVSSKKIAGVTGGGITFPPVNTGWTFPRQVVVQRLIRRSANVRGTITLS